MMEIRKISRCRSQSSDYAKRKFISRSCFAEDDKECVKICNARAQPLFCSFNLLFGSVLVARCRVGFLQLPSFTARALEKCEY